MSEPTSVDLPRNLLQNLPVTYAEIERAASGLKGQTQITACDYSHTLSDILGCAIWLKFENLQFTSSFKERGAFNRLAALASE